MVKRLASKLLRDTSHYCAMLWLTYSSVSALDIEQLHTASIVRTVAHFCVEGTKIQVISGMWWQAVFDDCHRVAYLTFVIEALCVFLAVS